MLTDTPGQVNAPRRSRSRILVVRRLAWFSPLPPVRSGIATYTTEVVPLVSGKYSIDLFPEASAFEFLWKHLHQPYDLIVYQLGNASCHDYMWPYLVRYPGLLVLHDAQLHQARALSLLRGGDRSDDYRAEFRYNHPDCSEQIAEHIIAGSGGVLFHLWPMLRLALSTSRWVAVHNARVAHDLTWAFPEIDVDVIRMGVPSVTPSIGRAELLARHNLSPETLVFAAVGGLTPEKRIGSILPALRSVIRSVPTAHLLLVGELASYYDPREDARALGIEDRVTLTGFVPDRELAAYIDLADVCLCLRWPTSHETSASWLRCLAQGRPTIISDLAHTVGITTLDPRTWTLLKGEPHEAETQRGPIAITIDVLDEVHSLKIAMRRLSSEPALRQELGANAKAYWSLAHTPELMSADYARAIEHALASPAPRPANLPAHLHRDGTELTRAILSGMGITTDAF
jgi:glycosyltransferase involved in cell wall biosynthesis